MIDKMELGRVSEVFDMSRFYSKIKTFQDLRWIVENIEKVKALSAVGVPPELASMMKMGLHTSNPFKLNIMDIIKESGLWSLRKAPIRLGVEEQMAKRLTEATGVTLGKLPTGLQLKVGFSIPGIPTGSPPVDLSHVRRILVDNGVWMANLRPKFLNLSSTMGDILAWKDSIADYVKGAGKWDDYFKNTLKGLDIWQGKVQGMNWYGDMATWRAKIEADTAEAKAGAKFEMPNVQPWTGLKGLTTLFDREPKIDYSILDKIPVLGALRDDLNQLKSFFFLGDVGLMSYWFDGTAHEPSRFLTSMVVGHKGGILLTHDKPINVYSLVNATPTIKTIPVTHAHAFSSIFTGGLETTSDVYFFGVSVQPKGLVDFNMVIDGIEQKFETIEERTIKPGGVRVISQTQMPISLSAGWHSIKIKFKSMGKYPDFRLYWRKQREATLTTIPLTSLRPEGALVNKFTGIRGGVGRIRSNIKTAEGYRRTADGKLSAIITDLGTKTRTAFEGLKTELGTGLGDLKTKLDAVNTDTWNKVTGFLSRIKYYMNSAKQDYKLTIGTKGYPGYDAKTVTQYGIKGAPEAAKSVIEFFRSRITGTISVGTMKDSVDMVIKGTTDMIKSMKDDLFGGTDYSSLPDIKNALNTSINTFKGKIDDYKTDLDTKIGKYKAKIDIPELEDIRTLLGNLDFKFKDMDGIASGVEKVIPKDREMEKMTRSPYMKVPWK